MFISYPGSGCIVLLMGRECLRCEVLNVARGLDNVL